MDVLELVTPPSVEPVTLADAKAHLRLEITDDDSLVSDLIIAAREACETEVRQSFITTQWRLHQDCFPWGGGYYNRLVRQMGEGPGWLPQAGGGVFQLPKGPLVSVDAITYVDVVSPYSTKTVDPSIYRTQAGFPGRVQPVFSQVWPIAAPVIDAIQILFTAGYGADGTFCPAAVRLAIKMLVAFYYENREIMPEIPDGIRSILAAVDHGSYA